MRDIVSCWSENAVNVSPYSSCSSYSSNHNCIITPTSTSTSIQNSVSTLYKLVLSNLKQLLITVTWSTNHSNQGLTVTLGAAHHSHSSNPSTSSSSPSPTPFRLNTNSRFFRKKKGTKLLETEEARVEILWDLSSARYESGAEPVEGFYVVILVDSEMGLVLGDVAVAEETIMKFKSNNNKRAKCSLIWRREHCSGNSLYNTRAQFSDTGTSHDLLIKCALDNRPVLSVSIDNKTVIRVKRLHWNFRGNHTIFVDGLLVDLLWDVHDWFFGSTCGYAVFMFRTRSGLDSSRLWLQEKSGAADASSPSPSHKDHHKDKFTDFSLLIYACKTS